MTVNWYVAVNILAKLLKRWNINNIAKIHLYIKITAISNRRFNINETHDRSILLRELNIKQKDKQLIGQC